MEQATANNFPASYAEIRRARWKVRFRGGDGIGNSDPEKYRDLVGNLEGDAIRRHWDAVQRGGRMSWENNLRPEIGSSRAFGFHSESFLLFDARLRNEIKLHGNINVLYDPCSR